MKDASKTDSEQIAAIKLELMTAILKEMEREGLSQGDVARAIGASHSNVNKIFRGRLYTTVDYLLKMAEALGLKVRVQTKRS